MLFCPVLRPHYSARSKRFRSRSCGPSKDVRPTQKFSKVRQRRPQGLRVSNMAAPYWKARRRGCSFSGPILCSRERPHGSSKTFVEHSRHVAKI